MDCLSGKPELDDVAERLADIARDIARIEDITPPEALERLHQALLGPVEPLHRTGP